jgi:hypothetical protein
MKLAILLVVSAVVAACSDDPAPGVTIKSATPDQLVPSDDTRNDLTIAVRYDDSDGDLGGGIVDVYDCRAAAAMTELAIPQIAADRGQHIAGTLELHVNDVGALASGALPQTCDELGVAALAANTAVFCVVLEDAAGHRGGGDCTQPIEIAAP